MDPEPPSHATEATGRSKTARRHGTINAHKEHPVAEEDQSATATAAVEPVGEASEHSKEAAPSGKETQPQEGDATSLGRSSHHTLDDRIEGINVSKPSVDGTHSASSANSVTPRAEEKAPAEELPTLAVQHEQKPGAVALEEPSLVPVQGLPLMRSVPRLSQVTTGDVHLKIQDASRVSPVMPSSDRSTARLTTERGSYGRLAPPSHFQPIPVNPRPTLQPFAVAIIGAHMTTSIGVSLLMVVIFAKRSGLAGDVCRSLECREYAKLLASSIDTTVSPCNSFTRFVCGKWERNNELSVRETLYERALDRMTRHLLTIDVPSSGQNSVQRAAAVYRSCLNVLQGKSDEVASVKGALSEAGIVWPRHADPNHVDLVHTLMYTSLRLGWDVVLRLVPRLSEERTTLLLNPGKAFRHLVQRRPNVGSAFDAYFNALKKAFGSGGNDEANISESVLVEDFIRRNLTTTYLLRTPRRVLSEATYAPLAGHRWKAALSNLTLNVRNLEFVTTAHEYVVQFLTLWQTMGEKQAHYLTSWAVVQVAALYANRELIFSYHGGSTRRALVYHGAFCVGTAYAFSHRAVLLHYSAEVTRGNTRADAERLAATVVDALFRRLASWPLYREGIQFINQWSTLSQHFLGFDIDDKAPGVVGYDMTTSSFVDNWRKSTLLSDNSNDSTIIDALSSLTLLALFHEAHSFQLLPVALSFPLFDVGLVAAVNYGGLGGHVASALGLLLEEAYSSAYAGVAASGRFGNLTACITAHSGQQDSKATMAMALTASALFHAYVHEDPLPAIVPGMERFTGTQMLFVSLCFALCESSHTTTETCDSALRNIAAFTDAFQCTKHAPMNPSHRCEVP
ncbi:hypothetical protein HPB50_021051 [Hyalomma asiaticum]|uniref:Uncharacterized protein n=1 Tax=Hyalomma asiaticum TaxID=266040 RepID=A0ACB7SJA5_HYAAI|nr:hypothetical protein HPB50_021051 [Hyalomma asiaticum]